MNGPERKIENEIINRLRAKGMMVVWLTERGRRGWPDLTVMYGGKAVFVEVKKPGGSIRAQQLDRQRELSSHGMWACICDDADDAVERVTEWFEKFYNLPQPTGSTKKGSRTRS